MRRNVILKIGLTFTGLICLLHLQFNILTITFNINDENNEQIDYQAPIMNVNFNYLLKILFDLIKYLKQTAIKFMLNGKRYSTKFSYKLDRHLQGYRAERCEMV